MKKLPLHSTKLFTKEDSFSFSGKRHIWYKTVKNTTVASYCFPFHKNTFRYYDSADLRDNSCQFKPIIEKILFDATRLNGYNTLYLQPLTSLVKAIFTIERSTNGEEFFPVKKIFFTQQNNNPFLNFIDNGTAGISAVYYRIKTIEAEGVYYSDVVKVLC